MKKKITKRKVSKIKSKSKARAKSKSKAKSKLKARKRSKNPPEYLQQGLWYECMDCFASGLSPNTVNHTDRCPHKQLDRDIRDRYKNMVKIDNRSN